MDIDQLRKYVKDLPDFSGKPAVALETTIISHGMPYPKNVETALAAEKTIRDAGAIPVTIGILDGKIKIGMTPEEIEEFGRRQAEVMKVSRRDIAYCVASGKSGATTVAATMILAHMANIKIFATGGLGGVHRNAQETFDISADLEEFARTPVAVVCSGPKAILDIPLTLEYLETKGVSVVGYKTDVLPLFYTAKSNFKLESSVGSAKEAADLINTTAELGLGQGMIIGNPIPEKYSLDGDKMEKVIEQAVSDCEKKGIKGKETTPYLLARIVELTGGTSLESNIALMKNNALVAAKIAKEL